MEKHAMQIVDLVEVTFDSFGDSRGSFSEVYRRSWFELGREMIQVNKSKKTKNSLVGMHYHLHQADYWFVVSGAMRAVLFDLRQNSPTQGELASLELSAENNKGIFIPPGIGHGFYALEDLIMVYLVDGYYNPADELGLSWEDPAIKEAWGATNPVISERDTKNPLLKDIPEYLLPLYPTRK